MIPTHRCTVVTICYAHLISKILSNMYTYIPLHISQSNKANCEVFQIKYPQTHSYLTPSIEDDVTFSSCDVSYNTDTHTFIFRQLEMNNFNL